MPLGIDGASDSADYFGKELWQWTYRSSVVRASQVCRQAGKPAVPHSSTNNRWADCDRAPKQAHLPLAGSSSKATHYADKLQPAAGNIKKPANLVSQTKGVFNPSETCAQPVYGTVRSDQYMARHAFLFTFCIGLSGCSSVGDNMSAALTDPARYDLYDCPSLEAERISLASQLAEIQGLKQKAETGVAGSVVAEMAYGTEYLALRGRSNLAEEAWRRNRCKEKPPITETPTAPTVRTQQKKGREPRL